MKIIFKFLNRDMYSFIKLARVLSQRLNKTGDIFKLKTITMEVTILKKDLSEDVKKLFELHKKDRTLSRILIRNDPGKYFYTEISLFKKEKNDFTIINKIVDIRISSNNRMYFVDKNKICVIYSKGKFWYVENKKVRPLTLKDLIIYSCSFQYKTITELKPEYDIFKSFSWINFLLENAIFNNVSFNSILKNKLYNSNDLLKHMYKSNILCANTMVSLNVTPKKYKFISKHTINFNENLNKELLLNDNYDLFKDTVRMADILGVKVNCKWSIKRLKLEHDKYSEIITNVIMTESNRTLIIKNIFRDFASNNLDVLLLETTKDLALEGQRQSHCVSTYSQKVDRGGCAIYKYKDYTAEICHSNDILVLNQLKGFRNMQPLDEIKNELITKITKYNEKEIKINTVTYK